MAERQKTYLLEFTNGQSSTTMVSEKATAFLFCFIWKETQNKSVTMNGVPVVLVLELVLERLKGQKKVYT